MLDIVGNKNLRQFWEELAKQNQDKICVHAQDKLGHTISYTYGELNKEINRAANLFIASGIAKGDRVMVQMTNTVSFLKVWFGLAKIGAVMVTVNTGYITNEFDHLVKTADSTRLICDAAFLSHWRAYERSAKPFEKIFVTNIEEHADLGEGVIFEEALRDQPEELTEVRPIDSEDVMEILFTSGTTSAPKGAQITHANLIWAGLFTSAQARMNREDVLLTTMPNFHVDFQCNACMPTLTVGGTLVMLQRFSAHHFWESVCLYRATIIQAVPMILRTIMLQPVKAWERNHCVRDVLYALPLSKTEYQAFKDRFGVDLLNSYGMTETLVGCITTLPEEDRRFPSVGRPYFGYEAKLVDDNGDEVPTGEIGTFMVRGIPGRTLFKGYVNNEKATRETLVGDGWMMTKDKGRIDEDGVFWFVDRSIDIIKRSGENISSSEVERVLVSHPKIAEAAVIGVPDPIRDQEVKAYVRIKDGESITKKEVIEHCARSLAEFKLPVYVEFRQGFQHTCTGKIVKELLKAEKNDETKRLVINR